MVHFFYLNLTHPAFTCSESTKEYQNNPQKLFKFKLWTDFAHFFIVSIVDFEHVNDSWTLRRIPDVKALLRLPKIKAESHG